MSFMDVTVGLSYGTFIYHGSLYNGKAFFFVN